MSAQSNDDQSGGGNVVGKVPNGILFQPAKFLGSAGTPTPDPKGQDQKQVGG